MIHWIPLVVSFNRCHSILVCVFLKYGLFFISITNSFTKSLNLFQTNISLIEISNLKKYILIKYENRNELTH